MGFFFYHYTYFVQTHIPFTTISKKILVERSFSQKYRMHLVRTYIYAYHGKTTSFQDLSEYYSYMVTLGNGQGYFKKNNHKTLV